MAEGKFVVYYRVSTAKQGRSGLGLEAQEQTIAMFLNGGLWDVVGRFREVESGKVGDDERPQLAKAIAACRVHKAKLLVAKLDRLSRDAHWLLGLEKRGIDFVCADNPNVNRMTITVLAAVAEHERLQISLRTKQALAARKARGMPLGNPANLSNRDLGSARGAKANRQNALESAADLAPILDELRAEGCASLQSLADGLNARKIPTTRGGTWQPTQVMRLIQRLVIRP